MTDEAEEKPLKKTQIEQDFLGKGFHKLDPKAINVNPPRITWDPKFLALNLERQNAYLKKLASTMNHAAKLVQDERDALIEIMNTKELQLEGQTHNLEANNNMIQSEVTRMNEQRQAYTAHVKELNARIRALQTRVTELEEGAVGTIH